MGFLVGQGLLGLNGKGGWRCECGYECDNANYMYSFDPADEILRERGLAVGTDDSQGTEHGPAVSIFYP